MGLFNFTEEEHNRYAKGSPTYSKMLQAEYADNRKTRAEEQALTKRAEWLEANKEGQMGRQSRLGLPSTNPTLATQGTGMYAEGVTPIQQFMMNRNFDESASGLPGISKRGMEGRSKLEQALLASDPMSAANTPDIDGGPADPAKVATAKWFMQLDDGQKKQALEAWRADKNLDLGTGYKNTRTGEVTEKDLQGVIDEQEEAKDINARLGEHPTSMRAADDAMDEIDYTLTQLNDLAGMTDYSTTGFGTYLGHIPLTDSTSWLAKRDTIVARLGLGQLAKMKSLSRTGASGLGQLSEKELKVLQEQLASLKQEQHPAAIKRGIANIYKQLDKVKTSIKSAQSKDVDWYDRNSYRWKGQPYDNSKYYTRKTLTPAQTKKKQSQQDEFNQSLGGDI